MGRVLSKHHPGRHLVECDTHAQQERDIIAVPLVKSR